MGLGGIAGLSAPALLQGQALGAASGKTPRAKSVILIWLSGGPSHLDMWDMKPDAPAEVRGPFKPIPTAVPGIDVCEHLPLHVDLMPKLALLRSIDASASNHTPITLQAGNPKARRTNDGRDGGGYPSMGSVTAKFRGPRNKSMPPFVALADSPRSDVYGAGQLGIEYEPLLGNQVEGRFGMPEGVSVPRLQDRGRLRRELDRLRRQTDSSDTLAFQDRYDQEALEMVLGGKAQRAFDVSREPGSVCDRYGRDSMGEKALLARRLVEAGTSFITMSDAWGHWDHHGDDVRWKGIEKGLKPMLSVFDRGVSTLINDLDERGLLDTTLVLVVGEFGRTPRINEQAGRHHWTPVMSMLVAGAGIRSGQVLGASDRTGGNILERRIGPEDLGATVFHLLGIDLDSHWINPAGRPVPIVEADGQPIRELV